MFLWLVFKEESQDLSFHKNKILFCNLNFRIFFRIFFVIREQGHLTMKLLDINCPIHFQTQKKWAIVYENGCYS